MSNNIRRVGNFGIANTSHGLMSFSVGQVFSSFDSTGTFYFGAPDEWNNRYQNVGPYYIIPMGLNNNLPLEIQRVLDESYIGEGILGKIQGLQWGEGPRLYTEEEAPDGSLVRRWSTDKDVMSWLESFKGIDQLLRCHTDLVHGLGYFIKIKRARGYRIGRGPEIAEIEHVPVNNARLEWPGLDRDYSERVIVGSFPFPDITRLAPYPIWDSRDPFRNPVSMVYQNIYSFCKQAYSTPRFYGALNWMKLSNSIAPLLINYNANASAISYHIESPQQYWDDVADKLKADCESRNEPYTDKLLEQFKDKAFEEFTAALSGSENVGKFLHTQETYNDIALKFQGWKVIPIDKKIKEFVDAQIAIANKGDSAATSGFGISPSLSNIIVEGKMNSGSEMLYALKGYFATEVAVPEMILFQPWNEAIRANFPGKNLKLGFYRNIVMKESEVTPSQRTVNNV